MIEKIREFIAYIFDVFDQMVALEGVIPGPVERVMLYFVFGVNVFTILFLVFGIIIPLIVKLVTKITERHPKEERYYKLKHKHRLAVKFEKLYQEMLSDEARHICRNAKEAKRILNKTVIPFFIDILKAFPYIYQNTAIYYEFDLLLYPYPSTDYKHHRLLDLAYLSRDAVSKIRDDLLSEQELTVLNSLLRDIIKDVAYVRDTEQTYDDTVLSLKGTQAYENKMVELLNNSNKVRARMKKTWHNLIALYEGQANRRLIAASAPADPQNTKVTIPVNTAEEILERIERLVGQCRSGEVKKAFASLVPTMNNYREAADDKQSAEKRINTHYLPTLETALENLVDAERRGSKKTGEIECLTISAMESIAQILTMHSDAVDDAAFQNVKAEVTAMQRVAKSRGDMPADKTII